MVVCGAFVSNDHAEVMTWSLIMGKGMGRVMTVYLIVGNRLPEQVSYFCAW